MFTYSGPIRAACMEFGAAEEAAHWTELSFYLTWMERERRSVTVCVPNQRLS